MTMSRIFGILSLIATVLTALGTFLDGINPKYSAIALTISGLISAITGRVQGVKPSDTPAE